MAERAVLTDMGVLDDHFAAGMLTPSKGLLVSLARGVPFNVRARSVTLAGLAARVAWFDDQVSKALDAGIDQVAVVGAGYDSRAWRMGRPGVQYFELDHAETQRDKRRRAPGPGPKYIGADLNEQSAGEALIAGGLDGSRPALFVVEGVSMYLDEEVLRHQLGNLRTAAPMGSRLAVDFFPPSNTGTSRNQRELRLQGFARVGSGERFKLVIDPGRAVGLVHDCGWVVTGATNLREAARRLVGRSAGFSVGSVNENKTLVAALRP